MNVFVLLMIWLVGGGKFCIMLVGVMLLVVVVIVVVSVSLLVSVKV